MRYVVYRTGDYGDEPNFTKEQAVVLKLDHVNLPYVVKNATNDSFHTEFIPQYVVSLNTIDDLLSFQKIFFKLFPKSLLGGILFVDKYRNPDSVLFPTDISKDYDVEIYNDWRE
jgi:hypothetical protein